MKRSTRSRFDFGPVARGYDRWYERPAGRAHDRVQAADVARLLPRSSAGQRLLDVGCGTGHWTGRFAARGYRVVGVDVSPEMLAGARGVSPALAVADARALPFRDAAFDAVATVTMLEFVPDPVAAVRELARCTRPGGVILAATLNRLAPLNRRRARASSGPYAAARFWGPADLLRLLAPLGEVRLAATSLDPGGRALRSSRRLARTLPAGRRRLTGPLLVAGVRIGGSNAGR